MPSTIHSPIKLDAFEQCPEVLDASQKRPEAAVQRTPVPPHTHALVFDVAPLVCVQSGAAMHRQKLDQAESHDVVEVDFVL